MRNLEKLWYKRKQTPLKKKIRLYETLVKSILLYNSCTWGLAKSDEDGLDSFHRRHLRIVVGIRWPHKINTKNLYKLTQTRPLCIDIVERRWKMLGHTLRINSNTPPRRAMKYFFENRSAKKYKGRKRATLITTINRDIKRTKELHPNFQVQELRNELNLFNARMKAKNRQHWGKIVKQVVEAAYSDRSER